MSQSTNTLIVTAASTSRAPSLGGTTTFAARLVVRTGLPLKIQIDSFSAGVRLSAPGLAVPLILQTSSTVAGGVWQEMEWLPGTPLELPATEPARFFRVLEQ